MDIGWTWNWACLGLSKRGGFPLAYGFFFHVYIAFKLELRIFHLFFDEYKFCHLFVYAVALTGVHGAHRPPRSGYFSRLFFVTLCFYIDFRFQIASWDFLPWSIALVYSYST